MVVGFWDCIQARDWDGLGRLLSDDFVVEWPDARLRIRGRESLFSIFEQSLIAKRLRSFCCTAETCLEFAPTHFTQMAGLVCYYDTRTHYYLRVTHGGKLGVVLTDDGRYDELGDIGADWPRYFLRAEIDFERLQFSASPDGQRWQPVGPVLDATKL